MAIHLLPDQQRVLQSIGRYNFILWAGRVSAGKSFGAALALIAHSVAFGPGARYLVAGRTQTSILHNLVPEFRKAAQAYGLTFRLKLNPLEMRIDDAIVYCHGADNIEAAEKIRGLNLHGAMLDEIAALAQNFIPMVLTRVRIGEHPVVVATFNMTSVHHWIKTWWDMAERHPNWLAINTKAPNPHADLGIAEAGLTGAMRERLINSEWADEEGLVYPTYRLTSIPVSNPRTYVSVDFGMSNQTAALIFKEDRSRQRWVIVDEYYNNEDNKLIGQHASDIVSLAIRHGGRPQEIIVDPSATGIKAEFKAQGLRVTNADNKRYEGVQSTRAALESGRVMLFQGVTPHLISEMAALMWDEKKTAKGEDDPVKGNDHACDALRYFCHTILPRRRGGPTILGVDLE